MDHLPPPPPAIERPAQPSLLVSARRSAAQNAAQNAEGAPVFYVDATDGDDRRSGRGPKEAWKSLEKVNATAFPPGSRVLFERGENWRGSLLASSSGTTDRPVTYGAYGKGDAPVIDARGASVAVSLNGRTNVAFDGLTITGAADTGLLLGPRARNVSVTNVTVAGNGGSGIVVQGTSVGLRIDGSAITGNGAYGIVHYAADNTDQVITRNTIADNGWRKDGGVYSGWNGRILTGEIAHNRVFNNGVNGGEGRSHGLYHDQGQADSALKIHDNLIHDNPRGAGILAKSSTEIYRNVIFRNADAGLSLGQNRGIDVTYRVYDNEFYDNNGGVLQHQKGNGSITLELRDNVFHRNGKRAAIIIADSIGKTVTGNRVSNDARAETETRTGTTINQPTANQPTGGTVQEASGMRPESVR
ncbi:right-handed parallel beta-helix repeat-containing protein [Azospirillum formosense]|uniref:right-handed parallel beta-helix repeat-containing protein n=1 Tax=Azospirillum formosense TaxID=861533 RepID=UPI001C901DD0|nr:right-handed parallel beta-helix repeat-containing protein [Azospirillum formosense]MBY3755814.1 right-handed parallel beta-helix repeat-containing protein [Azospirillum formosense]